MSRCRSCDAQVLFVRLDTGRAIPVDPIPDPTGTVAASRIDGQLEGWVVSKDKPAEIDQLVYRAHFAACRPDTPRVSYADRRPSLFDGEG